MDSIVVLFAPAAASMFTVSCLDVLCLLSAILSKLFVTCRHVNGDMLRRVGCQLPSTPSQPWTPASSPDNRLSFDFRMSLPAQLRSSMLPAELEFIATDASVKIRPTVKMDKIALLSVCQHFSQIVIIKMLNLFRGWARVYTGRLLVTGLPRCLCGWLST